MSSFEIVSEKPLSGFSEVAFANRRRLRRIWMVTPWVTESHGKFDFLSMIVEASRTSRAKVFILTRPPRDTWHATAIEVLNANLKPILLFNTSLHAKLYILECNGFRYALLGSPNLTRRADRDNVEIGIELRSSFERPVDKVSAMISELIIYASSLFAEDAAQLQGRAAWVKEGE